tara:strand:+ start:337 stop:597 length:261 start_codon:yes stop_codon:yes gene_type:complete
MKLEFLVEVWNAVKSHDTQDRKDAADALVNLLIDHNYEPSDIKEAFEGEREVLTALRSFVAQLDDDEEEFGRSSDEFDIDPDEPDR